MKSPVVFSVALRKLPVVKIDIAITSYITNTFLFGHFAHRVTPQIMEKQLHAHIGA